MSQLGNGPFTPTQKTELQNRLARIEGQLRSLRELISTATGPQDCDLAVQQLTAARRALEHCSTHLVCATLLTQADNARDLAEARDTTRHLAGMFQKYLS